MKKILILVCGILFFIAGNVSAVEIAWMQVQHRQYAGGRSFNRLGFGLIDARGSYLTSAQNIRAVKLYDPARKELKLSPLKFSSDEEIFGSYDSKNSQWYYHRRWQFESWFSADIAAVLQPGVYWLKVTTTDGKTAERTFGFNQLVALPFIDAGSFQLRPDPQGNLIWTWQIPIALGHLSLNHKLRARAAIDIYKGKEAVGYFSVILPVHMGYVFIPQDVVAVINKKGGRFELKVSLETRDKNNRTYSKPLAIDQKLH